ncbi:MAG: hypothetical protein V4586_21230 [Pseudomonadota bacterium]
MELVPDMQIDRALSVNLGQVIASSVGVQFSDKKPTVSGKITWGAMAIRAQVVAPPIVESGMVITLRPFKVAADTPIKPALLHGSLIYLDHRKRELGKEVLAPAEAGDVEAAMRLCVRKRLNVLISGVLRQARRPLRGRFWRWSTLPSG